MAGKAQGPERAAGEDSSGVGATAVGEVIQGKSGFGLNHYKVRGLTVPCSLTATHFLSTQRGLGAG